MKTKQINKIVLSILTILSFMIVIGRCSYIQINFSSITNYERLYGEHGLLKNKYLGYNDIFPDAIEHKEKVKSFKTEKTLIEDTFIGYLVMGYEKSDYIKEKNRLYSLNSDIKYDHYGIESFNKEMCAIYSDYKGVIYALANDKTQEISYIDIQFYPYYCELDYTSIISYEDLPIGFDASIDNQTRIEHENGKLMEYETVYANDKCNDIYYFYNDDKNELCISKTKIEGYEKSSFYHLHDLYNYFENNVEIIIFEKGEEKFHPYTMNNAFASPYLKKIIGFENIDTSNVIDFGCCFKDCNCVDDYILKLLKTDSGRHFDSMFYNCNSIYYFDSSNYCFSNAKSLFCMFGNCDNLKEVDLSNTNFRHVTTMRDLFKSCSNLEKVTFSNSNFINCVNLTDMFYGCSSLKEVMFDNVVMFNIKLFGGVFNSCSSLEVIDLSSLGFSNLYSFSYLKKNKIYDEDCEGIFKNCSKLKYVYLPLSMKKNRIRLKEDFLGCEKLEFIYYKDFDVIKPIKLFRCNLYYNDIIYKKIMTGL